jgi:hypothetical protein
MPFSDSPLSRDKLSIGDRICDFAYFNHLKRCGLREQLACQSYAKVTGSSIASPLIRPDSLIAQRGVSFAMEFGGVCGDTVNNFERSSDATFTDLVDCKI